MAPQNIVRHGDESFQPWLRWCIVFHHRGRVVLHSSYCCQRAIRPREVEGLNPGTRQILGCSSGASTGATGNNGLVLQSPEG